MHPFSSALDLAAAIRAKKLSPVEVVDAYLKRIDQLNLEVLWAEQDITPEDVFDELESRTNASGIEEKAARE